MAKEIQAFSETPPCFVANAPLRCQKYPDVVVQIFDVSVKKVLYEFNRTKNRVTIADLVLSGDEETSRFSWFNWGGGGMNMTISNPYVTVSLEVLAKYFYKSSSAPEIVAPAIEKPVIVAPVVENSYLSQVRAIGSTLSRAYASLPSMECRTCQQRK